MNPVELWHLQGNSPVVALRTIGLLSTHYQECHALAPQTPPFWGLKAASSLPAGAATKQKRNPKPTVALSPLFQRHASYQHCAAVCAQ